MSDDPNNVRHLANLDAMRVAMDVMVLRWAAEDLTTARTRAAERAWFEAGLAHFSETTGVASSAVVADVSWPEDNMEALEKRVADLNERSAAAAAKRDADAEAATAAKVAASMPPGTTPAFVPPEPVYTGLDKSPSEQRAAETMTDVAPHSEPPKAA